MNNAVHQDNLKNRESPLAPDAVMAGNLAGYEGWFVQALPGVVASVLIGLVFLAVVAGENAMMRAGRQTNFNTMQSVLTNTLQRFEEWATRQEADAAIWAQSDEIVEAVQTLSQFPDRASLADSEVQSYVQSLMGGRIAYHGYRDYFLIDLDGRILSSTQDEDLGQPALALDGVDRAALIATGSVLTHPKIVDLFETHESARSAELGEEATLYVIAPISGETGLVGYFALRIDPMGEYSASFRVGRTGVSGETFAIDRSGRLLTESRYESELVAAGVLPEGHTSLLHLDVRDPGADIATHGLPVAAYSEWPLTEAAASVISTGQGSNLVGYRNARGALVAGVWIWDEQREMGVITEIEIGEAFAGVRNATAVLRVFAVVVALSFILLAALFSVHRNVSRRRAMAIYDTKQQLKQILMTVAEGIYGIDNIGLVTFVNPQACRLLGYSEDELIGKSMHDIVHHSHRDGSLYAKEDCPIHTAGVPSDGVDSDVFWTKAGEPIPIEFSSLAIDMENQPAGAVVTFRDISKRKRDETALRRYALELKRSNAELQEFAYAASHDLQEPLRKIQAFGERLNAKHRDSLESSGQHYLDRMVDAASRMRHLIDDLLSYSRVNSNTTTFLPVDLAAIVADVISDLQPRILSENAKVSVAHLPAIEADPSQMHQLFLNLIANALKFRRAGANPVISIEGSVDVGENGAVARIAIADNGIGFEPRHAERIFGMFERLHGRETYDGTGVGLATSRKIAERHSGELSAWGEPDAGAVFTLILPIRQANLT
jgi:two-component system sensor kinase FixL